MNTTTQKTAFHQLFFWTLLFQMSSLFAQITVGANSFIYVDGCVLTSSGAINLVSNSSKLYLRNEAQLLQKEEVNTNQGAGIMSVYQNNNVHEYAYNFWCSPVGATTNTTINNSFKVNQIHDPLLATSSTLDSQPALFTAAFQGSSTPLTIAKSWLYIFQTGNASNSWSFVGDSGSIAPGLGFSMKGTSGSNNNQTYDFRGKPNNGLIQNTVSSSQWTLIGNPYPSALDAHAFIHDPQNVDAITGTLYFWQQDLSVLSHNTQEYVGGYASYTISEDAAIETFIPAPFTTYNSNGTLNTNGNPISNLTAKQVKRYLPIGQGFMVEGGSGTTGIVRAKNSHRAYYKESNSESEFFRTTESSTNLPLDYSRFRINIDYNNTYTRQLVQTFHNDATSGFDYGLESKSNNPLSNDGNWIQQNIAYASQATPFSINLILPIGIHLTTNSIVRFRAIAVENFDPNQPIYLYDSSTGLLYDLRTTLPEINMIAGNYQNRFDIRFTPPIVLSNELPDSPDSLSLFYHKKNTELVITNTNQLRITTLDLVDLSGKLIFSKQVNSDANQIKVLINTVAQGLYIAIVKNNQKTSKTKLFID